MDRNRVARTRTAMAPPGTRPSQVQTRSQSLGRTRSQTGPGSTAGAGRDCSRTTGNTRKRSLAASVRAARFKSCLSRLMPAGASVRPGRRCATRSRETPPSDEMDAFAKLRGIWFRLAARRSNGKRVSLRWVRSSCCFGRSTLAIETIAYSSDFHDIANPPHCESRTINTG